MWWLVVHIGHPNTIQRRIVPAKIPAPVLHMLIRSTQIFRTVVSDGSPAGSLLRLGARPAFCFLHR